ncbi:MAG: hypothetical protein ACOYOT_13370 [Bacteroidales bacterium]
MKKRNFILLFIVMFSSMIFGQTKQNAIGLRFGGGDAVGSEISYQKALKANNRLEVDLGFASNNTLNRMQITGLYQWVWEIQGALDWYAGVGGGLGQANYKNSGNDFQLYLNGGIGIQYHLDIPVQFSLDLRPAFGTSQFDNSSLALAVRYMF